MVVLEWWMTVQPSTRKWLAEHIGERSISWHILPDLWAAGVDPHIETEPHSVATFTPAEWDQIRFSDALLGHE